MTSIRKDLHILFSSPDVYSCLISMNERACQKTLQEQAFGLCIILSKVLEKVGDGGITNLLVKQLLKGLDNKTVPEEYVKQWFFLLIVLFVSLIR